MNENTLSTGPVWDAAKIELTSQVSGQEISEIVAALVDARLIDETIASAAKAHLAIESKSSVGVLADISQALGKGSTAEKALDQIEPLFKPGDVTELRALYPKGAHSICCRLNQNGERAQLLEFINEHNGRANLYFGANPRNQELAGTTDAASANDVATRRTVFLDLDRKDAPDNDPDWCNAIAALEVLGPRMIVDTGGGVHVWFDTEEVNAAGIPATVGPLKAAMDRFGSDNMSDAPRIARLPYTLNLPTKNKRVRGDTVSLAMPRSTSSNVGANPPTVKVLSAEIIGIAEKLNLPGKGGVSVSAEGFDDLGQGKAPQPAPSAKVLRLAVEAMPNNSGYFDDRDSWCGLGHAVKGAAMAGGYEAEGLELWLDFCARWSGSGDPEDAQRFWKGCNDPHAGWNAIKQTLWGINPKGLQNIQVMIAQSEFEAIALDELPSNKFSSPFVMWKKIDLSKIPYPDLIYSDFYARGYFSVTTAAPKVGKSFLGLAEALDMATGRGFLTGHPQEPLKVGYLNLEDDQDMLNSRVSALLAQYRIPQSELVGNLSAVSAVGTDWHLFSGEYGEPVGVAFSAIAQFVRAENIDILMFDPLQDLSHSPETNEVFRNVGRRLRRFASELNIAVGLIHHTRKGTNGVDPSMDDMRGGSALRGAARFNRVLVGMSDTEAKGFSLLGHEHRQYFRIGESESNLAPPSAEHVRWFKKLNVQTPAEIGVGAVVPWTPPDSLAGVSTGDAVAVRNAITNREYPPAESAQSNDWVGILIAQEVGLDPEIDKIKLKEIVKVWEKLGYLKKSRATNKARKDIPVYVIGVNDPFVGMNVL